MIAPKVMLADSDSRLLRSLSVFLESKGYEVLTAENGVDAVALVNRRHPDLAVLNVSLGNLSGVEVCAQMKKDAETADIPVLMMDERPDRATVVRAAKAGASDFIVRTGISASQLTHRIEKLLPDPADDGPPPAVIAAGTHPSGPDENDFARIERKLDRAGEAKALPFLASEILAITADRGSSARDLAGLIERDQAVTAKLLRLANSSMYGGAGKTTSVSQAVAKMGFRGVREMVFGMCVIEDYGSSDGAHLDRIAFWRHSIAVAALADLLLGTSSDGDHGDALIAGLLHDIGKAVADDVLPDLYGQVLQHASDERVPLRTAEAEILGADHVAIGMRVGSKWRLPDRILGAVAHHHKDWREIASLPAKFDPNLVGVIKLADILVRAIGHGDSGEDHIEPVTDEAIEGLGLTSSEVRRALGSLGDRVRGLEEVFVLYEEADLHRPETPDTEGERLLLLAPGAALDPVETMLGSWGYEVQRSGALPEDLTERPPRAVVFEDQMIGLALEVAKVFRGRSECPQLVGIGDDLDDAAVGLEGLELLQRPFSRSRMMEVLGFAAKQAAS